MIRVLFVDDEQAVLDGLRVRLRGMRDKWQTEFATSGTSALDAMSKHAFDVIVSDMRMPEMDGAALLRKVSEQWPHTVRIVLSGYSEVEQTIRLVPVAHQYLSKPCDLQMLENAIERYRSLRTLLAQPALRGIVGQLRMLPPIPETYAKLVNAMASETVGINEISAIVAQDTVIAARLLQLANSAFFRLPRRVSSIDQAVAYLGLSTVRNLVASAEVFARWPASQSPSSVSFQKLQAHALGVAAAVHSLTHDMAISSDALLAAMLHDIGYWILMQEQSAALEESLRIATTEQIALDEAERRVMGASHAEIGAYLLGLWGFSNPIVEAIAHHHDPSVVAQTEFDVLAALSVAHVLAQPPETSAFRGSIPIRPRIDAAYLNVVKAPFDWKEAIRRVGRATGGEAA